MQRRLHTRRRRSCRTPARAWSPTPTCCAYWPPRFHIGDDCFTYLLVQRLGTERRRPTPPCHEGEGGGRQEGRLPAVQRQQACTIRIWMTRTNRELQTIEKDFRTRLVDLSPSWRQGPHGGAQRAPRDEGALRRKAETRRDAADLQARN